jgi:phosphoglycolate phosphatase
MKRLLIFDFDGTLIDSAQDIADSVNELLNTQGIDPLPMDMIKANIGEGLYRLVQNFFPGIADTEPKFKDLESTFIQIYERRMLTTTKLFPGVLDFFRQNKDDIALVTNKNIEHAQILMKKLGLMEFSWSSIFGANSLPEKKPHPMPLLEAMSRAGIDVDNAVMIGDGTPDLIAAKMAGVRSIAVSYGYTPMALLKMHGPSAIMHRFEDLSSLLQMLEGG